jgi:hypothetical protein
MAAMDFPPFHRDWSRAFFSEAAARAASLCQYFTKAKLENEKERCEFTKRINRRLQPRTENRIIGFLGIFHLK